jgi:hypothetical protein
MFRYNCGEHVRYEGMGEQVAFYERIARKAKRGTGRADFHY